MFLYLFWEFLVDIWDTVTMEIQDNRRLKKKERKRLDGYLNVSPEILRGAALQDVFPLVTYRLAHLHKMNLIRELSGLRAVNAAQRIFWIANAYEQKNDGGGLCLFLASEFGYTAPLIPMVLGAIGAKEHLELYCNFIRDNKIDLTVFSNIEIGKLNAKKRAKYIEELRSKYNFSEFDEKYMALEPIEERLVNFVRENAEDILA